MLKESPSVEQKLSELREWFRENPKLPQQIDGLLLKRFLKCMYCDVAETKKLLELNYAMRNKYPELFLNRDPNDDATQTAIRVIDHVPLPGLTPYGCRIVVHQMADTDPNKMNTLEEYKLHIMCSDARFTLSDLCTTADDQQNGSLMANLSMGEIFITDISGYTMAHTTKISITLLRIYSKYLQEAYPVRLKAIHCINCPSYLNKMLTIIRPFIRDDVYKMIHFHTSGIEALYEHVPRHMLPEEFGGNAGKLCELKASWLKILNDKRDYLMDERQWFLEPSTEIVSKRRWYWF